MNWTKIDLELQITNDDKKLINNLLDPPKII